MAMPDRPLTDADIKVMLENWHERIEQLFVLPCLLDLITGERYQYVRYDAKLNRVVYEDIETFYFTREGSPSDSRWMVPK